jgi:hypothetical protein
MNPDPNSDKDGALPEGPEDDVTGLPVLRTWGRVYLFVILVFIIYVALLTTLSKMFA